jgi:hypothetical protein
MWTGIFNSPFVVAVAGCAMVLGLGCFGIYSEIEQKRMRSHERMALLSKGMSVEEVQRLLSTPAFDEENIPDPLRNLGNARRTAIVLLSVGVGLVVLGFLLASILQVRDVLAASAAGVIPIAIGLGFLVDYRMQLQELQRFGIDVGSQPASPRTRS